MNTEIALRAAELSDEGFHADPADRIITATALVGGYQPATADQNIVRRAGQAGEVSTLVPTD